WLYTNETAPQRGAGDRRRFHGVFEPASARSRDKPCSTAGSPRSGARTGPTSASAWRSRPSTLAGRGSPAWHRKALALNSTDAVREVQRTAGTSDHRQGAEAAGMGDSPARQRADVGLPTDRDVAGWLSALLPPGPTIEIEGGELVPFAIELRAIKVQQPG